LNPTVAWKPGGATKVALGYEMLHDRRVADRGITSFQGVPARVESSTFYGNPDDSEVRVNARIGTALVEHRAGRVTIRNRTMVADFDRFYQNYVPGAPSQDMRFVTLSAYNNATDRTNLFTQTDVVYAWQTGRVRQTLLAGAELGRQATTNFRQTGFFEGGASSLRVPFEQPTTAARASFRQSASDASNHVRTNVAALFVQDQVELSRHLQVLGGFRVDRFDLRYENRRSGESLGRVDTLLSPRAGVVVKPLDALAIYGSYSTSHLPSAGDQFSSLTTVTQQVRPEKFANYEVGTTWDATPHLSLTGALYRLDRTNTRATDPNDPTRIVQTGSQRTSGVELGVNGQLIRGWRIAGGYAYQDAAVTSATTAAKYGARVAQVPAHTLSLWNNVRLHSRISAGLGLSRRAAVFATIDNSVVLPAYTRVDAAAFVTLTRALRLQINVENILNADYFVNADSNTNISPGAPRAVRVALNVTF
ncbi:MAG: TonB-dependent receptor, partial [Vicinamibacterales bacterium]